MLPKGSFEDVFLMVQSQDRDSNPRTKRSPTKRRPVKVKPPYKGLEGACQLHSYYFDFSLGGWDDWVLSPSGFNANLCFGFCPHHMSEHMNTTNHAIIQQLMHSIDPTLDPPCCIPTEYEPFSLLIIEDEASETVNLKTFDKMVAKSCGCR